ncbi:MAG TPA: beta-glucosidase [Firmicutes bacterium]|jgi:beta-glucosidase|nr:beta-glucosidase [Bacillota bacterium]
MSVPVYRRKDAPVEARVEDLLSRMTLEEKVAQLGSVGPKEILDDEGNLDLEKAKEAMPHGIGQIARIAGASGLFPKKAAEASNQVQKYLLTQTRLGIPALIHEECLSGLMSPGGSVYPQSIGMASSFEPELMERVTTEVRKQMRSIGTHLGLSPVVDIARDFRWGRVEETFGEDPYLVASMATAYARGLQGDDLREGVVATLKHFAGHGVSEGGRNHAPVNVPPRELRETHIFPYEAAIRTARVRSVMNAYHSIDGIPCASSRELLTDILRGELGFEGIVVSDYYSIRLLHEDHLVAADLREAGVMALSAGLDVECPTIECYGEKLVSAVRDGLISEAVIDNAVRRHLKLKFELGLFDDIFVEPDRVELVFETKEQRELAREAARKSIVLLKNENNLLPLAKNIKRLAVIGPNANSTRSVQGDYTYDAHVDPLEDTIKVVTVLEGIKAKVSPETEVRYAQGCTIMGESCDGFAEAVQCAQESDLAVVVIGGKSGLSGLIRREEGVSAVDFNQQGLVTEPDGESHDRADLELTGVQEELVKAVYATGTPTVVVLINGRPLSIQWIAENIPAILEAWLPGEEAGTAVADVLFGDYNPGGKLPVSIPKAVGQQPVHYNRLKMSKSRKYISMDTEPLYPFGFGLSYTTFSFGDLKLSAKEIAPADGITISCRITNTGERAGEEVVQLYVRDNLASRARPIKELKGFKRIYLEPGETKNVRFRLHTDQLAFLDVAGNWVVEPGEFTVMVGSSSEHIHLSDSFTVTGLRQVPLARKFFSEVEVE